MPATINSKIKYKKVRRPRSKESTHYVDNKKFLAAFVEYHQKYQNAIANSEVPPRLPEYIGECFLKIAEKYSHDPRFVGYPFREEMISDAIENCIMYAHDFNPNKGSNPFAYFSQTVWNAFIRRINKENKNKYVTYKSHQMRYIHPGEMDGQDGSEENSLQSKELYDNITSYINEYERKIKEKKKEKKRKLKEKEKVLAGAKKIKEKDKQNQ